MDGYLIVMAAMFVANWPEVQWRGFAFYGGESPISKRFTTTTQAEADVFAEECKIIIDKGRVEECYFNALPCDGDELLKHIHEFYESNELPMQEIESELVLKLTPSQYERAMIVSL